MPKQWHVVDEEKARVLDANVRRVLKEVGIWVHHPGMLQALADKGARVKPTENRACLTDDLIDEAIALQRQHGHVAERGVPRSGEQYGASLGFEITPVYYDCDTGRARNATRDDLINMVKLAQMLPHVGSVTAPVVMVEVQQLLEPLESFLTVATYSDKPIGGVSLLPQHHPYFAELGEILASDGGRYIGCGAWMTSPLCVSERSAELFRLGPDYGNTIASAGSMIIAGLSGPITRAGAMTVGAGEMLGPWIGALALQPRITGFSGGVCTGVVDPRTARGCFGGPEPVTQDVGLCELFDHCYGGGVSVSGWGYVDGKVPGLQVAFEKVAKAMFIANARGLLPQIGSPGLLDAGRAFSPVQYLIELEMNRALWNLHRELDVSDEAIGMDTILEATAEYGSSFIGMEHTARPYRGKLWLPEFMDRSVNYPPPDQRLEGKIMEQANARWKELVAAWQPVDRPELPAIEDVVGRAREELPKLGTGTFVA